MSCSSAPKTDARMLSTLDTCQASLLHSWFTSPPTKEESDLTSSVVRFAATALFSLGLIVIVATLDGTVLLTRSPSIKLPLLYDANTAWMFLVTLPVLVTLLLSERHLIPERIGALLTQDTLRLSQPAEVELRSTWEKAFRRVNIVAQLFGLIVGATIALSLYLTSRSGGKSWQGTVVHYNTSGYIWLLWIFAFYWVSTIYVFRAVTTYRFLRSVTTLGDIRLVPFHPDNCGGLKPVGTLGLRNQYVLAVGGINLLMLIGILQFLGTEGVLPVYVGAAAVFYIICGPIAFLGPLLPFRQAMLSEKHRRMQQVGAALRDHYERCLNEVLEKGLSKKDEAMGKRLEKMMRMVRKLPVWPFDTHTLGKFLTAYLVPLLSMIGSPLLSDLYEWLIR